MTSSTKSHTLNCLTERVRRGGLRIALLSLAVAGCASTGVPGLAGPPRRQTAALVGRWRSAADSTAPVLELRADAVAVEQTAAHADASASSRRSWWWVYAAEGSDPERLCVRWRPGKHAAQCRPFTVDSAATRARRLHWGDRDYVQMDRSVGYPPSN